MGETSGSRWKALDVLRGAAVAGMIVVTSPGDWNQAYAPLRHTDWNGWTVTDMIFPSFLFAVGLALAWSFPRRLDDPAERRAIWLRIARRVAALIALGLALNYAMEAKDGLWFDDPGAGTLAHVRFPGVLQRIALCYLLAAALILATARNDAEGRAEIDWRAIAVAAAAALIAYWALFALVPVPGHAAGEMEPGVNLPGYVDVAVFGPQHMWRLGSATWRGAVTYDPEGLLPTLPATVNVLLGVLAGVAFRRRPDRALVWVAGAGAALFVAGLLFDPVFAINKRMWTSSFAMLSGGFSMMLLAAFELALRSAAARRIAAPLELLGGNAILGFTLSILLGVFAGLPIIASGDAWVAPQQWGNSIALGIIPEPHLASLACAFAILALILLAIWPLHRRGIHLRF